MRNDFWIKIIWAGFWKRKVWKVQIDAWTHQHHFGLKGGILTHNPMGWVCTFNIVYYLILGNKEGQESLGDESQ